MNQFKLFKFLSLVPSLIGLLFIVDEFAPKKVIKEQVIGMSSEINKTQRGSSLMTEYFIHTGWIDSNTIQQTTLHQIACNETTRSQFNDGDTVLISISPIFGEVKSIETIGSISPKFNTGIFHSSWLFFILPLAFLSCFHIYLNKASTIDKSAYVWIGLNFIVSVVLVWDYWR